MTKAGKDIEENVGAWSGRREWRPLYELIDGVVRGLAGRHPGIVTEAIVESVTKTYALTPREQHHRERRRNHAERIRRFSHSLFRILEEAEGEFPVDLIAASVLKAFILGARDGDQTHSEAP